MAKWCTHRFDVEIDPQTEVLPSIGSQEGTGHLPLTILNPQSIALLPDTGYSS